MKSSLRNGSSRSVAICDSTAAGYDGPRPLGKCFWNPNIDFKSQRVSEATVEKRQKVWWERKRPISSGCSRQTVHSVLPNYPPRERNDKPSAAVQTKDIFHFIFWEMSNYCPSQSTRNNIGLIKSWLNKYQHLCLFNTFVWDFNLILTNIYPGKRFGSAFSYFHAIKRFYGRNGMRHAKMIGIRGQPAVISTFLFLKFHLSTVA